MSNGVKFVPTKDGKAPLISVELQTGSSARFLIHNEGSADHVRITREQIPELITALQAVYEDPHRQTIPPPPLSKEMLLHEIALVFPKVDVTDGSIVYGDPLHEGIYSTARSTVWSELAYRPHAVTDLYRNGVHHLLAEWLESKGWRPVLQQRGCIFFPKTSSAKK